MFSASRLDGRIPVFAGPRLIEIADTQQAHWLISAPNATVVRQRRTGQIVEIHLANWADESSLAPRWGNPLKTSTNLETPDNPRGVWALKHVSG